VNADQLAVPFTKFAQTDQSGLCWPGILHACGSRVVASDPLDYSRAYALKVASSLQTFDDVASCAAWHLLHCICHCLAIRQGLAQRLIQGFASSRSKSSPPSSCHSRRLQGQEQRTEQHDSSQSLGQEIECCCSGSQCSQQQGTIQLVSTRTPSQEHGKIKTRTLTTSWQQGQRTC
jgi:hypothetical protein